MAIKEATMTASGSSALGTKTVNSKDIEEAMSLAVMECKARGIADPIQIKEAMMAARRRVLEGYRIRTIGKRVLVSRTVIEEVQPPEEYTTPLAKRPWYKKLFGVK